MEDIDKYREVVKALIREYAAETPSHGDIRVESVLDDEHGHYELVLSRWDRTRRVHGLVVHIDISDGKVYIERDGTIDVVAERLVEAGIPKSKIVLAFKPPELRPLTGFAVAQ